jgi:hypothetical protein
MGNVDLPISFGHRCPGKGKPRAVCAENGMNFVDGDQPPYKARHAFLCRRRKGETIGIIPPPFARESRDEET